MLTPDVPGDDTLSVVTPSEVTLEVRSSMRGALKWSLAGQVISRLGALALGMVMARLLIPEDFGLYVVAASMFLILLNLDDLGLRQAVVGWPDDFAQAIRVAWPISIVLGGLFYGVAYLLAPLVARATKNAEATSLIRLMCVGLLIDVTFHTMASAKLQRMFRQDLQVASDVLSLAVSATVSIVLAERGWGPRALAYGTLAGQLAAAFSCMVLARLRMRFEFDRVIAKRLLAKSTPYAMAAVVGAALLNIDYIILGNFVGAAEVGLYVLAFNIAGWPVTVVGAAVRAVALPGFTRLVGAPAERAGLFRRAVVLLVVCTTPFAIILTVHPELVIGVFYGDAYLGGARVLTFLAVLSLVRITMNLLDEFVFAIGKSHWLLVRNILWLIILTPALFAGAGLGGGEGAGVAQSVVAVGAVLPIGIMMAQRAGVWSSHMTWQMFGLVPIIIVTATASRLSVDLLHVSRLALLAVCGVVTVAVYGALVYLFRGRILRMT